MNRKKLMLLILIVCLADFSLAGCGDSSGDELTLGTGGKGGTYYKYGKELKKILADEKAAGSVHVQSTAGSASNLRLLSNGLADLAIVQNDTLKDAVEGTGEFSEDGPLAEIRAIAGLYTESCQIVAAKNSDIRTVSDLKGKRVSIGSKESGVQSNAEQILATYGLSAKDIESVNLSFDASASALKRGKIDAFFCTASAPTTAVSELAEDMDIRLVSLDKRSLSQIQQKYDGYSVAEIPACTYKGQTDDIQTIGIKAVLVTNTDTDPDAVTAVITSLFKNSDKLQTLTAQTDEMTPKYASSGIAAPFAKAA